ncbi:hypothetical protein ACJX0J_036497, partial [Zea mays]
QESSTFDGEIDSISSMDSTHTIIDSIYNDLIATVGDGSAAQLPLYFPLLHLSFLFQGLKLEMPIFTKL